MRRCTAHERLAPTLKSCFASQKGRLPLHNAVANYFSETEVQRWLDAYPDGAKATDWVSPPRRPRRPRRHTPNMSRHTSQAKCLPLHLAAANNYILEDKVVRLLLNAYPEGAQAVDLVSASPARPPRASHTARASARAEREARGSTQIVPSPPPFLAVRIVAATHCRYEQRAGEGGVAAAPRLSRRRESKGQGDRAACCLAHLPASATRLGGLPAAK